MACVSMVLRLRNFKMAAVAMETAKHSIEHKGD
jgi:hypothetical protein